VYQMKSLRILHVIPSLKKGGAERLCLEIVQSLKRLSGVEAKLVMMRSVNEYIDEYSNIAPVIVKSKVIPSILGKWQVELCEWETFVYDFKPDVIHSHLFEAEIMTRYRIIKGVNYFTHCHDNMPQFKRLQWNELLIKSRITEAYERNFLIEQYKICKNQFIAISPDTEQFFKSNLPKTFEQNIIQMPNAIDHGRFSADTASSPFGESEIRLINIGSFVEKKNQRFLLRVLLSLRKMGLNVTLTLIGDGPLRKQVQLEAIALGLENHIKFTGSISRVESLLWDSHVYVHSALYEPFGLVILEAMAAGLPVVALDGYGNRELHHNGMNGYLIKEVNENLFATRVEDCIRNWSTWDFMHSYALEYSKKYDIKSYVKDMLEVYQK